MRKYDVVDISEVQLEDLVRQAPDLIEAGLKFIDHQAFTDRGPLDVLFVDSGCALVVAELKVAEDDAMLVQGIDYYDYVARNLDGYARAYKQHKVDPAQEPRLFLIAPSFSITLLNRMKWIGIPVSLFTFQCMKFEDTKDEIIPIYKEISPPLLVEKVQVYTLEERLNYITDSKMRKLAEKVIHDIMEWDPERILVEAIKYSISIKVAGRVFVYVAPRRRYFTIETNDPEGKWTSYPINSENDLDIGLALVRDNFERIIGS